MNKTLPILVLLVLALAGCKHEYWTIVPDDGGRTVAVSEPTPEPQPTPEPEPTTEPQVEPPTPKQVIFILGIDGMD
jgi:hypothetical protein